MANLDLLTMALREKSVGLQAVPTYNAMKSVKYKLFPCTPASHNASSKLQLSNQQGYRRC